MLDGKRIKLLCAAFFILGVWVTLVLVALGAQCFMRHFRPPGLAQVLARTRSQASGGPEKVGPWGQLETIEVPLANPDGVFPDKEERLQNPKWFFEKFSENSLTRFLSSCNLCPTEKGVLLDRDFWQISSNGVTISPPEQIIWSLNPQGRQQIYSALANSAINYPQRYPFRIALNAFDLKFKDSGLPVEQIAQIRKLKIGRASCRERV